MAPGQFQLPLLQWLYVLAVPALFCACTVYFVHHREFAADLIAFEMSERDEALIALLQQRAVAKASFFHPSLAARILNLYGKTSWLRRNWLSAFYGFTTVAEVGSLQLLSEIMTEDDTYFSYATILVCLVGLAWDIARQRTFAMGAHPVD